MPLLLRAVAQAGGDHEVIVVDDASTDDSVAYLRREFPEVKVVALERNLRFAGANNAAARAATGEILVFLNNDMLVEPDFLSPLLEPFSDPEVFAVTAYLQMEPHVVGGGLVRETGLVRGRFVQGQLELRHEDPESGDPLPVIYAGGGSSAWRRDRFLELGGFDRLFRPFYFEDLDVSYRAQKHGWPVLFAPRSRMEHKHRQTNSAANFRAGYVDGMFRKNALLFAWKVLTDEDLVNAHFRALWGQLLRPRTYPDQARAFLRAARQLPGLLAHRARGREGVVLTDREVIARAAGKPRVAVAEGGQLPYGSAGTGKRVLVLGTAPLPFEPARRLTARGHRTWHVVQALLQEGHEVTLVADRTPGVSEDEARPPVLRFRGEHFTYYSVQHAAFEGSDLVSRLCDEVQPEAIVAVHAYCGWIASRLATDAPVWVDLHGYSMSEAQARAALVQDDGVLEEAWRWEKAALERADAVSVVSSRQKFAAIGELAALGRLSGRNFGEDPVHYMPNAIEPTPYKHQQTVLRGKVVGEGAFVVLWTGGYDTWTDVETLFAGLTAAMREDRRLLFVSLGGAIPGGDEQTFYRFRELVAESELADRFVFLGWVSTEELPNYYFESDVGLNLDRPSYEMLLGCRYRVMDMLRAGLPVVTSLGTELSHVVRTEKLGTTFTAGDPEGLARALLELARDESLRRRCRARAKEWVFKHRSVEQVMAPLRRWMQAPARAAVRARPVETNHVWRPRTWLGRFAQRWETEGPRALLRQGLRGAVGRCADTAARLLLRRRGAESWGMEAAGRPAKVLVMRAGALSLTREVVARVREHFPEAEVTVLAPQALVEETRFETEAPVAAAPGAGLVSYRLSRALLRELRASTYEAIFVAGAGNRRAEVIAALARAGRVVEVGEGGTAHTFALAWYQPLRALLVGLAFAGRAVGLSLVLGVVWGSLKLEGLVWRLRHRSPGR